MILYHIIYTSLYLQTLRKSATTKEHIPSKNGLSQDAEIPKSLSLVLLYWVQLKFSQWMFFVKEVHDGSWQFPTGIPREFQGSMDTKGLHPNQPSSGLLVSLFACFVVSYLHSEIHIITYVHTYIIYLSCPIPINCSYNSYIGIKWYKYITTIYKHID